MLTPTGVTFAQYWNAIKSGNITHVRFTFLGQNIVLDDSDVLVDSGVVVNDVFNGETDLVFGRTLSKQVTVTFINSSKLSSLNWTGEFTLEFGVEISGTTNWVTIGYFTGEKPKNVTTVQTIQFTAYDRMIRFETLADEFLKSLTYPKTIQEIYTALCTYVGLQMEAGSELPNIMSRSYASAPADMQGYTCRDLLGFIAEACGCYAKINSAGKVQMVWFTNNTSYAITATEEFNVESGDIHDGLTWDEADTYTWDEFDNFTWDDVCGYQEALRVDGVYVKQLSSDFDIYYPTETVDNVYCIFENPFLSISTASDITAYVAPIYDRLYAFGGYLPVRIECVGNWCVEAGDVITVDVNNITVSFPIFVKEMAWNGSVVDSYDTTANNKRQVYASEATKQRVMTSNKIEMYVNDRYYEKKSGISIDENGVEITGDKYIEMNSGGFIDIGNWRFNNTGAKYSNNNCDYLITDQNQVTTDTRGAILFKNDTNGGYVSFYVTKTNNEAYGNLIFGVTQTENVQLYAYGTRYCILGHPSFPFADAYLQNIVGRNFTYNSQPGKQLMFVFDYNYDSTSYPSRYLDLYNLANDSGNRIHFDSPGALEFHQYCYFDQGLYNGSSREIKRDIKDMEPVGDKIDKLNPVSFVYSYDKDKRKRLGLIYEDTIDVLPEICSPAEAGKGIDYTQLIPVLLKEIQDLRRRVAELEKEVRG